MKKRKAKVFLLFLALSTLAWLLNNLSQTYVSNTTFVIDYTNPPENYILSKEPKKSLEVRLKAVGFQFLSFGIRKKRILIDLSKAKRKDSLFYVPSEIFKRQIATQISRNMELLALDRDTIFMDFTEVLSKQVPVLTRINLSLAKNYMLDGEMEISPNVVTIKGPKNQIDTVKSINTVQLDLLMVDKDFAQKVALVRPKELDKTLLVPNNVTISGKVHRFAEKALSVPVTMINVPDSIKVRMFPDRVNVVCQGKLEDLKALKPSDFLLTADYLSPDTSGDNKRTIALAKVPSTIRNASLEVDEIEFILRRE
ncbi:CdaR family protein [Maribacter sp. CXY002]|uniref:CdaR family protein n=1 Tax=Maribacter luteocoastalis TaxID=3407671 RepID=UPI003B67C7B7